MKIFTLSALLVGLTLSNATSAATWPDNCDNCGRVLSVEKVDRERSGTGGAVAGALIGGLIGNQVGSGDGKKLATVAGAAGGAYAGKKMAENNQAYKITVKMRDGHTKVVYQELLRNLKPGQLVRVRKGTARPY